MNLTGGIILYAVIWFLTFYIVIQIRTRTQADEGGEIVPGTPASAPAKEDVGRSALIATVFAAVIWGILATIILSGAVTIRDIDFMGVLDPEEAQRT